MNNNSTCQVPKCGRPSKSLTLCQTHYKHYRKGTPISEMGEIRTPKKWDGCRVEDCPNLPVGQGLCSKHHTRLSRGWTLEEVLAGDRPRRGCDFPECDKPHYGHGLCSGHYTQQLRGRALEPLTPFREPVNHLPCTFDGCMNNQDSSGYCLPHYKQSWSGLKLTPIEEMRRPATYRNESGEKWCSECKSFKAEEAFTKLKRAPDGLDYTCKKMQHCQHPRIQRKWSQKSRQLWNVRRQVLGNARRAGRQMRNLPKEADNQDCH